VGSVGHTEFTAKSCAGLSEPDLNAWLAFICVLRRIRSGVTDSRPALITEGNPGNRFGEFTRTHASVGKKTWLMSPKDAPPRACCRQTTGSRWKQVAQRH